MNRYCMLNGHLLPEGEACFKINDLGVRRGYGIFDFFRVRNGVPMYAERHFRRFLKGAQDASLPVLFDEESLATQVRDLIRENGARPEEGAIRLLLTGGESPWESEDPNLVITFEPLKSYDQTLYKYGARVITHEYIRELPDIKTISYMTAISLTSRLKEANAIEVLYHMRGDVSEFSRSNIFLVKEGLLITPDTNILSGITRSLVLELASNRIEVRQGKVMMDDVLSADEVFMTSTIKRIIPVTAIDGQHIAGGKPGPVTGMLMTELAERDEREIRSLQDET